MALTGTFPLAQMPLLPRAFAATQTQVSGAPGVSNRTITSPPDFTSLTFSPGGQVVQVNPSMMDADDLVLTLKESGLNATLDRFGRLLVGNATSVSGNANLKTALGLA